MIAKAALATAIVFLPTSAALAFGQEGHSIIGEIANRRLTAQAPFPSVFSTAVSARLRRRDAGGALVFAWTNDGDERRAVVGVVNCSNF
jgi:hypothetical protein